MGVTITKNKANYLNYFLLLERDLENIFKYIEPEESNMDTFSLENARLFLSICSEVDILFKKVLSDASLKDINQYRNKIRKKYGEKFWNQKVEIEKYAISADSPWINFKDNKSPDWWKSYNNIKHDRLAKFDQATLKNIINAISGLFILVCFYISDNDESIGFYSVPGWYKHINHSTSLCKLVQKY